MVQSIKIYITRKFKTNLIKKFQLKKKSITEKYVHNEMLDTFHAMYKCANLYYILFIPYLFNCQLYIISSSHLYIYPLYILYVYLGKTLENFPAGNNESFVKCGDESQSFLEPLSRKGLERIALDPRARIATTISKGNPSFYVITTRNGATT